MTILCCILIFFSACQIILFAFLALLARSPARKHRQTKRRKDMPRIASLPQHPDFHENDLPFPAEYCEARTLDCQDGVTAMRVGSRVLAWRVVRNERRKGIDDDKR